MIGDPRVIERGVIHDEIDPEPHAARMQLLAHGIHVVPGPDRRIRRVRGDAEGGSDHVVRAPTRQRAVVRRKERRF